MDVTAPNSTNHRGDDVHVHLRPPRLRYEALRAEIQEELDYAFRYRTPSRYARDQAHGWRAGTEQPPDTLFLGDTVLVMFDCDNECPRRAQLVVDEIADSMGRKAPRLTRWHTANVRPAETWPEDFLALFDEPEPVPHHSSRRFRAERRRAAKRRAADAEAQRWRVVEREAAAWHAEREATGGTETESL